MLSAFPTRAPVAVGKMPETAGPEPGFQPAPFPARFPVKTRTAAVRHFAGAAHTYHRRLNPTKERPGKSQPEAAPARCGKAVARQPKAAPARATWRVGARLALRAPMSHTGGEMYWAECNGRRPTTAQSPRERATACSGRGIWKRAVGSAGGRGERACACV